ncbi:MAG: tRNA pseudouridine(38-40) synthase TruA [Alistipes sp.]|nr:tRNA pseudouridine(38-40) synthase TruA [Alistipes sp.]
MRYFIELSYDGKAYCGWQRQREAPSVQQTLEQALTTLLRTPCEVVGAGRTDTGVNASYYVAHFDADNDVDCKQLAYKLNLILPADIAVARVYEVDAQKHARYDAVEREYTYFISQRKNPFRRYSAWQYYVPLDMERMNQAAAVLLRYDDFTSFAKLGSNNKTNICRIMAAEWHRDADDSDVLVFKIRADRFLRNMVRAIVGTLVDVGRGRLTVEDFERIVVARDLSLSSAGAPAEGLFLSDVCYSKAESV